MRFDFEIVSKAQAEEFVARVSTFRFKDGDSLHSFGLGVLKSEINKLSWEDTKKTLREKLAKISDAQLAGMQEGDRFSALDELLLLCQHLAHLAGTFFQPGVYLRASDHATLMGAKPEMREALAIGRVEKVRAEWARFMAHKAVQELTPSEEDHGAAAAGKQTPPPRPAPPMRSVNSSEDFKRGVEDVKGATEELLSRVTENSGDLETKAEKLNEQSQRFFHAAAGSAASKPADATTPLLGGEGDDEAPRSRWCCC